MFPGCYGDGKPRLEECLHCGEPTGRAGRGEDSLYCGDVGPFCEECYSDVRHSVETDQQAEIERLQAQRDEAREAARWLLWWLREFSWGAMIDHGQDRIMSKRWPWLEEK